ncbi:MAG: zinc-binding dehydrogenase, partial [Gemmatimonadales bacterium]
AFLRSVDVEPIDYRDPSWPEQVRATTGGRGVDIVLDPIGGRSFKTSYGLLAPAGRLFCYGVSTMATSDRPNLLRALAGLLRMPRFGPIDLMMKNRSVTGVNVGRLLGETAMLQPQFETLIALSAERKIEPVIDRVYAFEEAPAAHARLHARENIGKVLLTPTMP